MLVRYLHLYDIEYRKRRLALIPREGSSDIDIVQPKVSYNEFTSKTSDIPIYTIFAEEFSAGSYVPSPA